MIAQKHLRVRNIVDLFLEDRARYYESADGRSRHYANVKSGLTRWVVPYIGDRWLYELDAVLLNELLAQWVESSGLARTSINRNLSFVRQMIRYAVCRGYARPEQLTAVEAVERIRAGRYGVTDTEPRRPVEEDDYRATLPHLPDLYRDAVELMYYTGMRPCEVRVMTVEDLHAVEVDGHACYLYLPGRHKTGHLGKRRPIALVTAAYELVSRRVAALDPQGPGYVFSRDGLGYDRLGEGRIAKELRAARKAAGVGRWTCYQLRHRFATEARAKGLRMKRLAGVMGHTKTRTTEIYAQPSDIRAIRTMLKLSLN